MARLQRQQWLTYPNNTYGYGRVDALAAVREALTLSYTGERPTPELDIALMCNPITNAARFRVRSSSGQLAVNIYSTEGRLIYSFEQMISTGEVSFEIPLSHLPNGLYFWRAQLGSNISIGKFVLQR